MEIALTPVSPLALFGVDLIHFVPFILFVAVFKGWMTVDCATRESIRGSAKAIWILCILFVPLGGLTYFLARKIGREP